MDASTSLVGTQIGATLLAVGGMQWLKKASWFPLLKEGQAKLNRLGSLLIAGGIALGIHITFTGSASAGWAFSGTIPSLWVILTGLFHWAAQFIYQETGYSVLTGLQALTTLASSIQTAASAGVGALKPTSAVAVVEVAPSAIKPKETP